MCSGQDYPLKETCYRFTATPSEFRQSYFLLKDEYSFKNSTSYQKTNIIKKGLGISRNSFLHKNIQSIEMAYTNDTLI